jgi:hypothetical protein
MGRREGLNTDKLLVFFLVPLHYCCLTILVPVHHVSMPNPFLRWGHLQNSFCYPPIIGKLQQKWSVVKPLCFMWDTIYGEGQQCLYSHRCVWLEVKGSVCPENFYQKSHQAIKLLSIRFSSISTTKRPLKVYNINCSVFSLLWFLSSVRNL